MLSGGVPSQLASIRIVIT